MIPLKVNTKSSYLDSFHLLKNNFLPHQNHLELSEENIKLFNIPFQSQSELIFPNDKQYYAPKLSGSTLNINSIVFDGEMGKIMQISDDEILENKNFKYVLIKRNENVKSKGVIILFHGLNEKDWTKYLPWAKKLHELTGKAIILFPIAFHIDRAHASWHQSRTMQAVSQKRQALFYDIHETSFTNAAMSTRLHFAPTRFFFSGLETYSDVIQLVKQIRSNQNDWIAQDASVDFLGYSAGAFLAQILLMANRDNMFSESKAILFCGGLLLSRMHLTSRYIMDSEAHQAICDFYVDNFEKNLKNDAQLNTLFESVNKGGLYFKSMLSESYGNANQLRRQRFEELKGQFLAVALEKDTIMPPHELQASLIGTKGTIAVPYKTFDYAHAYSHMNPFPAIEKIQKEVSESFDEIFEYMANFIG